MQAQQTIRCEVSVEGRGLFGGRPVQMRLKPAEPDSGIVFVRTDFPEPVRIPVGIEGLASAPRRTVLQNGSASVETVEHFLAAVNGLGIDNLIAEINGIECPNTDGSCELFTRALAEAGILEQDVPSKPFVITEPLAVQVDGGHLYALPDRDDELNIIYDLDYHHVPVIGRQLMRFKLTPENFQKEISTARTFSTDEEAQQFQAQGFGKHLTARDVLVLGPDGPIDNELRFQDECVRHKIADLLGDIMLFGRAIRGRLVAYRSGHRCNHQLVRELLKSAQKHEPQVKTTSKTVLDIRKIQKILPHRYPFLLVDRVVEIDGDHRAVGIKNVTMNEFFFQGHYPGSPIMPGVLIIEALAQMSGLLFAQKLEHIGQLPVLLSMDKIKMRRPVVPGDQLILEVEAVRMKTRTGVCRCRALVEGQLAAEAQLRFMLVDADPS